MRRMRMAVAMVLSLTLAGCGMGLAQPSPGTQSGSQAGGASAAPSDQELPSRVEDRPPPAAAGLRDKGNGGTQGSMERGQKAPKGMDPGPCSRQWGLVEACGRVQRILCPRAN
ncbi:MAG: hypothetical protein IMX06_03075 [Kyrpidia tusciae]|nr:hypothetical protein [Kyrpidia tusciae]MBE3551831.1 hypothetical protein [Kyrpidia tusciae]